MSERSAETIRTEIAAERTGLERDLDSFRDDARRFALVVSLIAVAVSIGLFLIRLAVRLAFRRR